MPRRRGPVHEPGHLGELGYEVEHLREACDQVIMTGRLWARGRLTGADVNAPVTLRFRFEGDLIAHARTDPGLPE